MGILQSEIPRTFVDCNRVIDAPPEAFREGKVTPGVPPWIRHPDDLTLLRDLHGRYVRAATTAIDVVCGAGGRALLLHTYAPWSVDVEVDADIVANMHAAYADTSKWPVRPEVDVIGRALDGTALVDPALLDALTTAYARIAVTVADGLTYPMHPSTHAFHHAARWPGRALCVEVRRDLLAEPFSPFAEMRIPVEKAQRMAGPIVEAMGAWTGR